MARRRWAALILAAAIAFLPLSDIAACARPGTTLACAGKSGFSTTPEAATGGRSCAGGVIALLIAITAAVGFAAFHRGSATGSHVPVADFAIPLGPFW